MSARLQQGGMPQEAEAAMDADHRATRFGTPDEGRAAPAPDTEDPPARDAAALEAARAAALRAVLTRLRIAGFKSFAEPTTVEVMPGLTGIVGPNGCGKSNVVEALRWAMGETNARAMRGGEMDDVIFAGTATRAGRNQAEVTLLLEDASGLAPPPNQEAPELEITRRIVRGEGTGFRINGRETRGRDVQTLFADIGSGARSSAMVSQGKVATLIAAKPEERRQVLEEAAGIAGLRARRHEAELKLRQAETNLTRADDLKGQLDVQRTGLQRQARQAARYRNLSGLTRQAEAEYFSLLVARAEQALSGSRAAYAATRAAAGRAEQAATEAATRAFAAERALPAPREAEAEARTALERRRVEQEGLEAAERRARAAFDAAATLLAQIRDDLGHATRSAEDAEAAEARLTAEAASLEVVLAALPGRQDAAAAAQREAEAALADAEAEADRAAQHAAEAAARHAQAAAEASAAEGRAQRLEQQRDALATEARQAEAARVSPAETEAARAARVAAEAALVEIQAALEQAEARRVAAQDAHAAARRAASEIEAARSRATAERDAAAARARQVAEQRDRLRREHRAAAAERPAPEALEAARAATAQAEAALAAARTALSDAEAARSAAAGAHALARGEAGAAEAARARAEAEQQGLADLLRSREAGGAVPILDSITVPPGLEAALGAALGDGLESPNDLSAPRHWRQLPPLGVVPDLPGGAVALSTLVDAPPELARALSQVGLLENVAPGAALQPALAPGQSLVTRDGALWRWDGHGIQAGAPSPGAVRLTQRNRLRAADAALLQAAAAARTAAAGAETAKAAEARAGGAEAAARAARTQAEAMLSRSRDAEAALATAAARAESRLAALEPQLERLEVELRAAEAARDAALATLEQLPDPAAARAARDTAGREEADAQAAETAARDGRRKAEAALEAARRTEAGLASRAAGAETRLAALAPQLSRVAEEHEEARRAAEAARHALAALPDLDALRGAVEAARQSLGEARARAGAARDTVAALAAEAARAGVRLAAIAEEHASWTGRRDAAAGRLAELRRRAAEAEAARDAAAAAPEEAAARRAAAGRVLAEAEARHAEAAARLKAAEAEDRAAAEARRLADAAFAAAREAQLRAEAAVSQAEALDAGVAERLAERLGEDPVLPPPPDDLSEAAEERARRKAERLAREREEMGPVNLRAEQEVLELEERIGLIDRDRDEIGAAIAKLRGSIGHLNREGRERLRAVFHRVDGEFRALFGRLFGGGRAHLALVGSDDPLEAGLEIYAEPPGKKLATLSLLSGGEQALTALSLIFAVFRCQPAPVCVLDEVDAPLDDANVERLCGLLDSMAAEAGTRFLVVTHHPLTMARMHRLYGVTMQERGVSRLLSVDLGMATEMVEAG
ncbi:AAA family ATPase [Roseomonas vastitatis]|uniref:Chromosome partition protein Smc n=1 Tax=Teichococcus vastitatis TaxID=2307076 RepID=A0ABS9W4H4_9PROT|nr:AAA family ATPase [Pseudoroseomonas vastitatis]MCI0753765.1 AAA family ATPase [Pseudoroseomonas vastitatis]